MSNQETKVGNRWLDREARVSLILRDKLDSGSEQIA